MVQNDPQNKPKGQVRTMADDLAKARGEKPKTPETDTQNADSKASPFDTPKPGSPTQPASPQEDTTVESLDELLPLEEGSEDSPSQTDSPTPPAPPTPPAAPKPPSSPFGSDVANKEKQAIPENLPVEPSTPETPAQPIPPAAPKPLQDTPTESKGLSGLESEIFPDPNLDEPGEKPAPSTLSDEELPSETPEELLGMDKKEDTPAQEAKEEPTLTPENKEEGKKSEQPGETEKKYMPLSPEPESFHLSMGEPKGPLYEKVGDKKPRKLPARNTNKMLILGSLIVLLAVLAGGAVYFFFFGGRELIFDTEPEQQEEETYQTPQESPPPPPAQTEVTAPAPLITPDFEQQGLIAANTQTNTLEAVLERIKNDFSAPARTITYMPIQLGSTPEGGEAEFINLPQFLQGLGISVPEGFYDATEEDLMLYAYSTGDEERIMCQNNLISQQDCYGARTGLVIKAKEGREADLNTLAAQLETQVATSNFKALVLSNLAVMPQEITFESEQYQSTAVTNAPAINIRFVNIPMPSYNNLALSTTAIDIAVVNNYLVISTSKNSVHSMLDKILQSQAQ